MGFSLLIKVIEKKCIIIHSTLLTLEVLWFHEKNSFSNKLNRLGECNNNKRRILLHINSKKCFSRVDFLDFDVPNVFPPSFHQVFNMFTLISHCIPMHSWYVPQVLKMFPIAQHTLFHDLCPKLNYHFCICVVKLQAST
jgi:hypothetical protein